ncbi:hypothetical protein [Streptomyces sp. NPDC088785]|uniref:hypothetical protein n=1 Tax=Streptomyces sp. NPDC088785 TaxID=3365897 RepID=UPI0037F6AC98
MAEREPNHLLAALLAETDWTAGELARAVNALGAAQGMRLRYDRTAVAHWLSGSHPRGAVPSLIAAALTERLARPVTPGDAGLSQPPAAPPARSGRAGGTAEADGVHGLFDLVRADTDPSRHAYVAATAYTVSTLALPAVAARPLAPVPLLLLDGLPTDQHLESMRDMIRIFPGLYLRHGGAHARTALASYLAHDTARIIGLGQPERLRGDVLTAAAQLLHQLGEMTADSGHEGLAQQYLLRTLRLAAHAGDRDLYVITLRTLSSQALRLGNRRYAHHLVRAALHRTTTGTSPAIRSFLHAHQAVALALLGRRQESRSHLHAAERHHARASSPAGPFTDYPQAALDYQRAQTLHALGEPGEARTAYLSAIHHRPDGHHRPAALTRAKFAQQLLAAGELEASCGQWHAFLGHYAHLHSSSADHAFGLLRRQLRPHHQHPRARSLLERAHAMRPAT